MAVNDQSSAAPHLAAATPADTRAVGLIFSADSDDGIVRRKVGAGFRYQTPDGDKIDDQKMLERIRALAIPPAWTDVWICASPRGHLQATGRDDKGRKQYRYHPKWRSHREETKFGRLADFGRALPSIREQVENDLHRQGLPREKVLAAIIRLLEQTGIRVGNDEYARTNKSYGLTTLNDRHVSVGSTAVRFKFRGKSGKDYQITLQDRRLARIVKRCQDLPGQRLFVYEDENGDIHRIGSSEVNDYLREITEQDFTAKDFRTWVGTVHAVSVLRHLPQPDSDAESKRQIVAAVDAVAEALGNTRAVARASYIHPAILTQYESGSLQKLDPAKLPDSDPGGLDPDERVTLAVLDAG